MSLDSPSVTMDDVLAARARIGDKIRRTPVLTSSTLDAMAGARLFLKCENFQRAGVFKARGAFNAVFSLDDAEAARGVVTSSSGNHAAAVSLAARTRGIRATIAMPKIALASKIAAVRRYGGEIVWVEGKGAVPTSEEYDATVARIERETGAATIHPYNDRRTIAGQATCALELLEDQPDLDVVLAPVGGGGLLAGTAVVVKAAGARIKVVGCEPQMADDAQQSLRAGHIVPQLAPRTIADGLRTSLGDITFPLIQRGVDDIVTVTEEGILHAMRLVWEVLKIVIEPSGAVPLAALLERRVPVDGRRVGLIVSGGNADLDHLPWIK
ncbi:MAG TPA: pyridoxal-phosphate dependent enzyme [Steroidobacteraceae bacterium]|jgi:threonine dehydratase|nr:pyridoxal-phosphate dependent enzyme [Steroidobacteraceae bacterium]